MVSPPCAGKMELRIEPPSRSRNLISVWLATVFSLGLKVLPLHLQRLLDPGQQNCLNRIGQAPQQDIVTASFNPQNILLPQIEQSRPRQECLAEPVGGRIPQRAPMCDHGLQ